MECQPEIEQTTLTQHSLLVKVHGFLVNLCLLVVYACFFYEDNTLTRRLGIFNHDLSARESGGVIEGDEQGGDGWTPCHERGRLTRSRRQRGLSAAWVARA
jgi:hypothetical protein